MDPTRLLPLTAEVVDDAEAPDPTTFVVTAGAGTVVASGIPARLVRRSETATVRDDTNEVVIGYDLLLGARDGNRDPVTAAILALGRVVNLSDGTTARIAGAPLARRRRGPDPVSWTVPVSVEST